MVNDRDVEMKDVGGSLGDHSSESHAQQSQPSVSQSSDSAVALRDSEMPNSQAKAPAKQAIGGYLMHVELALSLRLLTANIVESSRVRYVFGRGYYQGKIMTGLRSKIRELEGRNAELEERNQDLSSNNNVFEKTDALLKEKIRQLLQEKEDLQKFREKARDEKRDMKRQQQEMQQDATRDQETIRQLQGQITHYKKSISAATRPAASVADDTIKEMVDTLFCDIQAFVLRVFRHASFDFALVPADAQGWMNRHVTRANSLPRGHWYKICISVVARALVSISDVELQFGKAENKPLAAASKLAESVMVAERDKVRTWLKSTRDLIVLSEPKMLLESEGKLKDKLVLIVEHAIVAPMRVEWDDGKRNELKNVLDSGLNLLRLLSQQPATYLWEMAPAFVENKAQFVDPERMQDVQGMDEGEDLAGRLVEISVFPGVYKMGEAKSENPGRKITVCKARVVPGSKHSKMFAY